MKDSVDEKWMRIALSEAQRGIGLTSPNPAVGAVIVKDGIEIARGWHAKAGTPHAERVALNKLESGEAVGSTAYVTLEPCSTCGRTGACVNALIEAGVSRVVYGALDPNPDHAGAADGILNAAGIEVLSGICRYECEHLIRAFSMTQLQARPWVIAKTAMTLDGRITRPDGEGQWLSCESSREEVQLLRAEVDGIICSGETVRRDNPALTLRSSKISEDKVQPWRVVLTRSVLDKTVYQIFNDAHHERTLLFENDDPYEILRTLSRDYEVQSVLIEAGGNLLGSFLDAGLIDEWVIYMAPMVSGGETVSLAGNGVGSLNERISLTDIKTTKIRSDVRFRALTDRSHNCELER